MSKNIGRQLTIIISTIMFSLLPISSNVFAQEADEAPPSINVNVPAEDAAEQPPDANVNVPDEDKIILTAEVFPQTFNPKLSKTTVTYEISQPARIDLQILDKSGQTVVLIVNNQLRAAGEYDVDWNGTKNNQAGGEIVSVGTYKYKIDAKNTSTGAIEATAQGDVNVAYPPPTTTTPGTTTPGATTTPTTPGTSTQQPQPQTSTSQAQATLAIQNAVTGVTAETGPGILLYSLLPIAGLIFSRRKK